ncbi:hypothetical protein [Hoeflea alexandrii]|uniref:hypothetical protein n=1 Tax=Hoeflea alexandrii TaxID=288436 RepID=UPI0022AEC114|nr:hypothetical protein [Hoeflea alexandrii]MCZ4292374.1 hypothetical protein [Hoeflea alexandrii]
MRFFAALAVAIGRLLMGTMTSLEKLLSWPWRMLSGSRPTMPHYEPSTQPLEILEELAAKRAKEAAPEFNKDGISSVMAYTKALPPSRPSTDLSALKEEVRDTLLCMSDDELKALSRGGIRAARLFVSGRDHGINGVPIVRLSKPPMTAAERSEWKADAQSMKTTHSVAFR